MLKCTATRRPSSSTTPRPAIGLRQAIGHAPDEVAHHGVGRAVRGGRPPASLRGRRAAPAGRPERRRGRRCPGARSTGGGGGREPGRCRPADRASSTLRRSRAWTSSQLEPRSMTRTSRCPSGATLTGEAAWRTAASHQPLPSPRRPPPASSTCPPRPADRRPGSARERRDRRRPAPRPARASAGSGGGEAPSARATGPGDRARAAPRTREGVIATGSPAASTTTVTSRSFQKLRPHSETHSQLRKGFVVGAVEQAARGGLQVLEGRDAAVHGRHQTQAGGRRSTVPTCGQARRGLAGHAGHA